MDSPDTQANRNTSYVSDETGLDTFRHTQAPRCADRPPPGTETACAPPSCAGAQHRRRRGLKRGPGSHAGGKYKHGTTVTCYLKLQPISYERGSCLAHRRGGAISKAATVGRTVPGARPRGANTRPTSRPRGVPMVGPPPVGCAPRKTRRTWSSGPPSGPQGAAAAAQRRPSAGRERPQSPRCADRLQTCGNEMTVRGGAGAEKLLLIDGVFTGQNL